MNVLRALNQRVENGNAKVEVSLTSRILRFQILPPLSYRTVLEFLSRIKFMEVVNDYLFVLLFIQYVSSGQADEAESQKTRKYLQCKMDIEHNIIISPFQPRLVDIPMDKR